MNSFLQAQANRPEPGSQEGPRERPMKARLQGLYYGKPHMECYHSCQQCFDTTGATGLNRTPFAVLFLYGRISFRWHQYKHRSEAEGPLPWAEFKACLRKNLGDSRAFVDTIWSRAKRDSRYQQEEVLDLASYLENLQSILIEFDADGGPKKSDLIQLFRERFKDLSHR